MASVSEVPLLKVNGVTLRYRIEEKTVTATERVGFRIEQGDRVVLLGPSGCGKSTLLKAVGGFLHPSEGSITLNGRRVEGPGPDRVMVFQEFDQLLPWKTVKENVMFGLTASRTLSKREAAERALESIRTVHLEKFADAYPHTLSGGMKQRVAIARCLAMKPDIILMDEPFAALDALSRRRMQDELLELWNENRFTMLFVTHSIEEALLLGSRIVVMSPHPGRVAEILEAEQLNEAAGSHPEISERIKRVLFRDAPEYVI
ncbi:ABC transporter ATP-binding protein [Geotalea sp. SG265]|uniref:ABC transporter ATP-binding protein n=1 Tax=Geotalea sp. SG265 TaxID=2922867 RepID=UPI001FAFAFE4|nr:ABC transporter ATP-binding protein [Geotalea sp. SG265]